MFVHLTANSKLLLRSIRVNTDHSDTGNTDPPSKYYSLVNIVVSQQRIMSPNGTKFIGETLLLMERIRLWLNLDLGLSSGLVLISQSHGFSTA